MKTTDRADRKRRELLTLAGVGLTGFAGAALSLKAHAQAGYPTKPIRMIVPLAAASAVDVAARVLAQKLSATMGQNVLIENIVGASGIIGAEKLSKAVPDGYTIGGFNDSILTMVPNLSKTPFNPVTDFSPITIVADIEFSIAVPASSPFKTAADLVAAAKAAPGKYTYGSGGNGSPQHLAGAMFAGQMGIDLRHVPYRGASQAALDTAGGQVDMTMQGIATVASLVKGGKLRLIAVMRPTRHPEFPDAPTLKEVGINDFTFKTWFGMNAPPGTPKEIIDRLHREVVKALADPDVKEKYATLGLVPNGNNPDEMAAVIREQLERYGKAVRDNNIKVG